MWKTSDCDYIYPVSTNNCDLRIHGNSKAVWNEQILINEDAATIYNDKTIIIFEILDFNAKFLREMDFDKLDKDHFYRIAWGYLRPFGFT